MASVPRQELDRRLAALQAHCQAAGLDGALIHGVTNLFYFTGTAQQAHLWAPVTGRPTLLVRRVLERARAESALEQLEPIGSLRQLAGALGGARRIGMELDILPVTLFGQYQRALPDAEFVDIGPATRLVRSVKSDLEIAAIRHSARVADLTLQAVKGALREGMTELELSAVAEDAERRNGNQGMLRWRAATGFECPRLHLLAGESLLASSFTDTPFGGEGLTPAAPYGASLRRIGRGVPVCLDTPTVVNGYIHDQTRTLAIGGLDEQLTAAYGVCREIQAMIRTEARPGVTGEALWNRSMAIAEAAGLAEHFMGWGANRVRFVGHGVGLELDELPVLAPRQQQALEVGHVIAVEPKFFFPGKGAVGLENTFVITSAGAEMLTVSSEDLLVV
ncbi:MAG TPA: Xaa-Pro peptidase family protein [Symbiobacteriaceae bacterium]|nr:Xaa-Pro peptidase family protein [Symbiobacteriaceae bacterium]